MKKAVIGLFLSFFACFFMLTIIDNFSIGVQNIGWEVNFYISVFASVVTTILLWVVELWDFLGKKLRS